MNELEERNLPQTNEAPQSIAEEIPTGAEGVQATAKNLQAPVENVQPSGEGVQTPVENMQTTTEETQATDNDSASVTWKPLNVPELNLNQEEKNEKILPVDVQDIETNQEKNPEEVQPAIESTQTESTEEDLNKEKMNKEVLNYIEINEKNEGGWESDFKFAKELVKEDKLELALKLSLLAREAQIKEKSQKETPTES
jgi:hypothetical protein